MAAVQVCEVSVGGVDRLSIPCEIVGSSGDFPGRYEHAQFPAKTVSVQGDAKLPDPRDALSLSGSRLAGIHVCDSTATIGPPDAAPFPNAPRTRRPRSRRDSEQEREGFNYASAASSDQERLGESRVHEQADAKQFT